ncbi:MAG: phosphoribosylformylglycinamidine synthase subunit PurS [Enterovirga sp.]|jgi:phosphoribosylformylglycinamidine synthase PurS subunit|nr:phosphoribosylformylglycinamidine synthase subunit PurS [Enterovirga sp.]
MRARVVVTLKSGVLDPQGKAIEGALASLGIGGVVGVRQGKVFDLELLVENAAEAESSVRQACERLLANTVIENFRIEFDESTGARRPARAGRAAAGDAAMQDAAVDAEMPTEGHP